MPPEAVVGIETLAAAIRTRTGDPNPGLRFEDRSWTWAEVVDEMETRARLLRDLVGGAAPRHVGVLLDNVPEFLFLLGGAALSGCVLVGINSTRRGEELARDIRHSDCQVVITEAAHSSLLDGLDLGAATERVHVSDSEAYAALVAAHADGAPVDIAGLAADDTYVLVFTSGSTGAPKAVRVSQGRAARQAVGPMGFGPGDALYCAMPVFHGNAQMAIVFPAIGSGATIVFKRRFSASQFIPDIRKYGCTFFSTVGRALSYVLATPEQPDDGDNPLKYALAPESSSADIAAFQKRFKCYVVAGYGSSENAIVMVPDPSLPTDALGRPLDGIDVAIVDPDTGEECPRARLGPGGRLENAEEAIGEIVGRNVLGRFEGYYNNAEATEARVRAGWYWSGDLGYRTTDDVFFFAGRASDWLRVDGENFAAAPVERILDRFPGVRGVAVFGVPDERTVDDQMMAVLEMDDPEAFDPAAFDAFLAGQADLGTKWSPRYVRVVEQLPVGATNKTNKAPLKKDRWNVVDALWWRSDRKGPLVRMRAGDVEELHARFAEHGREGALDR